MRYIIFSFIFLCFGCKTNKVVFDDLGMLVVCWEPDDSGGIKRGTEYYRPIVGIKVEIYRDEICFTYFGKKSCENIINCEDLGNELKVWYKSGNTIYYFVYDKIKDKIYISNGLKIYELIKTK